jgi:hypothetical protein
MAAGIAIITVIVIEIVVRPYLNSFISHEVDWTLRALQKKNLNQDVVILGDSIGRGIFSDWKFKKGSVAKLACNQATETAGQYFFLQRFLENNRIPGAVIICDRSPVSGNLDQILTENYIQRCFTKWAEIFELFRVKLDPVFTVKMISYKMLNTFKYRLHLQQHLVGFTNSNVYSGAVDNEKKVKKPHGLFKVIKGKMEAMRHESISFYYLQRILKELNGYGVPLYYLPPPTMLSNDDYHRAVEGSLSLFKQLGKQYPDVHVLEGSYTRLPMSDFSDGVHLNEHGLAKYRPSIQSQVDKILQEAEKHKGFKREAVYNNGAALFKYSGKQTLSLFHPINDTSLNFQKNSLVLSTKSNDPALLLPAIEGIQKKKNDRIALKVSLNSESNTIARIYYSYKNNEFDQKHSVRAAVRHGLNTLFFMLPDDFREGNLRLDPGEAKGVYVLDSVEGRIIDGDNVVYF